MGLSFLVQVLKRGFLSGILTCLLTGMVNQAMAQGKLLAIPADSSFSGLTCTLNTMADTIALDTSLEILLVDRGSRDPGEVLANADDFGFEPFVPERILPAEKELWGRLRITNQLDPATAPSEWVLDFSGLFTEVQVYVLHGAEIYQQTTGFFSPISGRDFSPISDQYLVRLSLPPGTSRVIYFQAVSEIEQNIPISAPELQPLGSLMQTLAMKRNNSGFFNGFMFMILVYSLILLFFHSDRSYLYYSGYVLALILWWSFNRGELPGNTPLGLFDRNPQYVTFFKFATYLGLFCYLAFIMSFLELRKLLPWWNRLFTGMIWVGVPLLIIDIAILWNTNFSLKTADVLSIIYILSFVVLSYLFLWPLYKTKDKRGTFIILGMLAMGGGFLLTAIYRYSSAGLTLTYFQIGSFIEVMIFSLGLAYRSNQVRKERQQAAFDLEKSNLQKQKQEAETKQLKGP